MIRIILFLLLIALAAAGAAWVADQTGEVVLSWGGWRAETTLPVLALGLGLVAVASVMVWTIVRALWRMPARIRHGRRERRHARGRHAITQGLLAIGHGDSASARAHAEVARRHAAHDPLALLLHAQSAQLDGDREGAQRAFRAMAEREDTRLLGLRGLFIEAQRADDPVAAVMIAEEALKLSPSSSWASHAVLGFCCAKGDWAGALKILDNNQSSGLIDKATYRRQRGVLLTARALELETVDRDLARESVMEAVKFAPTLVPAAVLASKFESEAHQVRRSMRIVETAWLAQPHPDLADAYAHVKLGDSARQRLVRVETLAAKVPGHIEGALAIARAAIDASEFAKAREALAPFVASPTQRVALLMAEIERTEHGDGGRARSLDLARGAGAARSGLDRGRLCLGPLAAGLAGHRAARRVPMADAGSGAAVRQGGRDRILAVRGSDAGGARAATGREGGNENCRAAQGRTDRAGCGARTQTGGAGTCGGAGQRATACGQPNLLQPRHQRRHPPPPAESAPAGPAPLFRARADLPKAAPAPIPAVIPIVRAPDDPGIDEDGPARRIRGANRPAKGPGRRLARFSVPLGD